MENHTFQPPAPVRALQFQLRERWIYAGMYGILLPLFGAIMALWLVVAAGNLPVVVSLIFMLAIGPAFLIMAFGLIRFVWVAETRQEGLYLRGMLGNAQTIPWQEIRRIAYQREKSGRVLFIGSSSMLQSKAAIIVSMISASDAIPEPVNNLIDSIAEAARLTPVKELPFGGKVYERQ